jgi:hypothetical protein
VDDVAIVDELANPLNDDLVQRPTQSRGVGDAEQLMPGDDVGEIPRLDMVVEGDKEVEIVRRLVHASMVPRPSDVFGIPKPDPSRVLRCAEVAGGAFALPRTPAVPPAGALATWGFSRVAA